MLTANSLRSAMSGEYPAPSFINYATMLPEVNDALLKANCTTNKRAAMFLAQIGAESGSLRWMEEIADGSAYEWRQDLGNIYPGDGRRFKGRGPIQVTGRHNYTKLSEWAYKMGYVPTRTYFVDHPTELSSPKYRWYGAIWYWTVARNMNYYADRDDIRGATYAVNGGYNNLSGREARWRHCRSMGDSIVPKPRVPYKAPAYPLNKLTWYGVKRNARAKGVLTLQRRLQKLGYAPKNAGWADGVYGRETAIAVNKFKKRIGWKQNGAVGIQTWKRLFVKSGKD